MFGLVLRSQPSAIVGILLDFFILLIFSYQFHKYKVLQVPRNITIAYDSHDMTEYEDEEYDVYKIEKVVRKKKPKKRLPDLVPKK